MAKLVMLGRNAMMLQMGAKPLIDAGHRVTTLTDDAQARALVEQGDVAMLIIGMAVEAPARQALRDWLAASGLATQLGEPQGPQDLPGLLAALR